MIMTNLSNITHMNYIKLCLKKQKIYQQLYKFIVQFRPTMSKFDSIIEVLNNQKKKISYDTSNPSLQKQIKNLDNLIAYTQKKKSEFNKLPHSLQTDNYASLLIDPIKKKIEYIEDSDLHTKNKELELYDIENNLNLDEIDADEKLPIAVFMTNSTL